MLIVCNRNGMYRAGPKNQTKKKTTVAASENSSHKDSSTLDKASGYSFPSFFLIFHLILEFRFGERFIFTE